MHASGLPLTREGDPAGDLLFGDELSGAGLGPAWNRAGPPWRGRPIIIARTFYEDCRSLWPTLVQPKRLVFWLYGPLLVFDYWSILSLAYW